MTIETSIIQILDALVDPLLSLSGEAMGLRYQVECDGREINIQIFSGFPCALLQDNFYTLVKKTLEQQLPQYLFTVTIQQFIQAHKTQFPGKGLRGVKNTLAIASGKGGVGKSTLTVNLAAALVQAGAKVGILDADIYGPSMPLMLGKSRPPTLQGDFYLPIQAHGLQTMSIGYLAPHEQTLIWRGPMLAKSLIQMLDITLWDELDYLLVDLPPGTGDIQLTLAQKIPLAAAIIITTPQQVATLDAQKAITLFTKTGIKVIGVIENMSVHHCSQCGHQESIFGHGGAARLCEANHCALLGQLPLDTRIQQHADQGKPIALQSNDLLAVTFQQVALRCAIELAKQPVNYLETN